MAVLLNGGARDFAWNEQGTLGTQTGKAARDVPRVREGMARAAYERYSSHFIDVT